MRAGAQEQIGDVVIGRQLGVRHVAGEVHVRHAEPRAQLMQHRQVLLEAAVGSDQQQPRPRVEVTLVGVEVPDDVFDALVRNDSPDEQDVRPVVVELPRDQVVRRQIEMREVGNDWQHAGGIEAQRFELLAVELGVAERQIDARRVDAELAAPLEALLDELLVHVDEELGRRDVVVDENLPIGKRVGDARGARADREMMNQDVRRVALLDQVAIVPRQVFEARIGRLDEDVGLEAGAAQHALDAEHFVADGVAIAERGEHLMDLLLLSIQHRSRTEARPARRWQAGGPCAASRAIPVRAPSRPAGCAACASSSFNCASTSRYFCSMTGHA